MEKNSNSIVEGQIPAISHDFDMARMERLLHGCYKIMGIMAVTILLLAGLLVYSMYDYTSVTLDGQDGGNASYIGQSGVINNGSGDSTYTDEEKSQDEGDEGQSEG